MKTKFRRISSLIISVLTVLSAFSLCVPLRDAVYAAESVTVGDEAALKAALEGEGGSYSLSSDITVTKEEYAEFVYTVTQNVTLDLMGHRIVITNNANLFGNCEDSTLIKVENGASLVINDSSESKSGALSYHGGIHLFSEDEEYTPFSRVTGRHLVHIASGGTVTVNSGILTAGSYEKEWLHRAAGIVNNAFEYYTGFAENVVCGTVFDLEENASLTVNGGEMTAHGRKRQNILPNLKGWDEERSVSVCIRAAAKAKVTVNDGAFTGAKGADVFYFDVTSKTSVKAGSFKTESVSNERIADYYGFAAVDTNEYYGRINLPTVFIPVNSRDALSQGGEPLEKTADAVDGKTVYLTPYTGATATVKSDGISTSYAPGSKGGLTAAYTKYFSEGSEVHYSWTIVNKKGQVFNISNSDSATLDLATIANKNIVLSVGSNYDFRCVITETFGDYSLVTVAKSFGLETKNKYILAAVSLTPSKIDDSNNYIPGNAPTFTTPNKSNYSVKSVSWYERFSTTPVESPVVLKRNTSYYVVFTLESSGNYVFDYNTRISFLPGGTETTIIPSSDGKSATVAAWVYTACDHPTSEFVPDHANHTKLCSTCGKIISIDKHVFGDWTASGEPSETVPMQRACTVCGHAESSAVFPSVEGEKTPIYEVKTDFGVPTYSSAPAAPTVASTPDTSNFVIDSYTWTTVDGAAFTKFEAGKSYLLTVKFKVADVEKNVFSDKTLHTSVHYSTSSAELSEDMTELTVTYTVNSAEQGGREVYLPVPKLGQSISNTKIEINGRVHSVYWYRDAKLIGGYSSVEGVKTMSDFDADDGIDFETAVFEAGHVYYCRIHWVTNTPGNIILSTEIEYKNSPDMGRNARSGERGFVSAYYLLLDTDKHIRNVKVTGITAPSAGATPKTSGGSTTASCTVKSIAFSCDGKSVSKFECGKSYTVKVTLAPKSGYSFSVNNGAINGSGAKVSMSGSNLVLTYTFPALNHDFNHRNAEIVYPTCDAQGTVTATCKSCSLTSVTDLEQRAHSAKSVSGVESSCSYDGLAAHYLCPYCLTLFKDAATSEKATLDALVIAKDETKHTEFAGQAHDGNDHYSVCADCSQIIGEKIPHEYGEVITDEEGYQYHFCSCGHYVGLEGPKLPEFVIGGSEEVIVPPETEEGLGIDLNGFSLDSIKTILIIMVVFAALLIGSIIAISIILIVTRDKSGKQKLPESEGAEKEHTMT